MHSLLARQLRRHFGADYQTPPEWAAFLALVDEAYRQSDADRLMLERSLELSSQELIEIHRAEKESLLKDEFRHIEAERNRFKALADTVPAGVLHIGSREAGDFVNREWLKITGLTPAEASGKGWWTSIHPADLKMFREHYDNLIKTGASFSCEYRVQTRQTKEVWVYCTAIAEPRNEVREAGYIFCIVDLTERKNALKQIERSQRLQSIGVLAGGISHDLNNALAPIHIGIDLFSKNLGPEDQRLLKMIGTSARRSSDLVRNLHTFAKGVEGVKTTVSLKNILHELGKVVRSTFPQNIELALQIPDELPTVQGNFAQLHQVLLNIVVNARDAMPDGGRLTIEAKTVQLDAPYKGNLTQLNSGSYVVITVTDTGAGMTPEIQDHIFEPFFTTKDKGGGLGLSNVAGILDDHKGDIHVYSIPGRGSTFNVYLPVQGVPVARPAGEKNLAHPDGRGRLILFVDDETDIRAIAVEALRKANFEVIEARNGTDALLAITNMKNELRFVITDIHMPNLDGVGFIRIIKRMIPGLPIIAMSGRLEAVELEQLKVQNVTTILEKPFSTESLMAALAALE
jgi:PAS domain S-box-containing protein